MLRSSLPSQTIQPYQFGKFKLPKLNKTAGKVLDKWATSRGKKPAPAPEAPEQKAIEHKPMLALPAGKGPAPYKPVGPKMHRVYGTVTLPGGKQTATSWTRAGEAPKSNLNQTQFQNRVASRQESLAAKPGTPQNRAANMQRLQEQRAPKRPTLAGGSNPAAANSINAGLAASGANTPRNVQRGKPATAPNSKPVNGARNIRPLGRP